MTKKANCTNRSGGASWTTTEIRALKKHAKNGSSALKKALSGRSHSAIRTMACNLKISIAAERPLWTDEVVADMKAMVDAGTRYAVIAKKLGRTEKAIQARVYAMKKAGVVFTKPERPCDKPKKRPAKPVRPKVDEDADMLMVHRVVASSDWRIDHPVVGRSVFELEAA